MRRFALIAVLIAAPLLVVWIFVAAPNNVERSVWHNVPVSASRIDELRKIAIAEVKKREDWSGTASRPSQEGNLIFFYIMRDSPLPRIGVQVQVDCNTGQVVGYDRPFPDGGKAKKG